MSYNYDDITDLLIFGSTYFVDERVASMLSTNSDLKQHFITEQINKHFHKYIKILLSHKYINVAVVCDII